MSRTLVSFNVDGHRVAGIATDLSTDGTATDRPLIVALHGGTYTSAYFDVEGHSLLETGRCNGFDVVALDRPGYGASDPLPDEETTFARGAAILDAAVEQLWRENGAGRPGIVLIGHSIGAAIAMHVAARHPSWPLLGLAVSGIHDVAPPHVRDAWNSMPPGQPVVLTPEQRRQFFYGPDWTIEPGIVERAAGSTSPVPLAELLEVVGGWPADAAGMAARVQVPVDYVAYEFEQLWTINETTVRDFGAKFAAAPVLHTDLMRGTGHLGDHHRTGLALQLRQLAFALECARSGDRPSDMA